MCQGEVNVKMYLGKLGNKKNDQKSNKLWV